MRREACRGKRRWADAGSHATRAQVPHLSRWIGHVLVAKIKAVDESLDRRGAMVVVATALAMCHGPKAKAGLFLVWR